MPNLLELKANEGEMIQIGHFVDCPQSLKKVDVAYNQILWITNQFDNCSGLETLM